MIFDWVENSRKILRTKKLSADDDWERRRKFAQEMALCQYLIQEGKTMEEIRFIWESLEGGSSALFTTDAIGREKAFREVYGKALSAGALKELPEVSLTKQELSYLNSLKAPYEIRKYWIRLLVYIKTKRALSQTPKIDKFVETYLMRSAGLKGRRDNEIIKIRNWSLRCGIPFPVRVVPYNHGVTSAYFPLWVGGDSVAFVRMGNFNEIDKFLERKTFICGRCGKKYDATATRKTELCPVCQVSKRKEYKNKWMQIKRSNIEEIDK